MALITNASQLLMQATHLHINIHNSAKQLRIFTPALFNCQIIQCAHQ